MTTGKKVTGSSTELKDVQDDSDLLTDREPELDKIQNQLKKTILKLVFSYSGVNSDIDSEIDLLKEQLRNSRKEDDRRRIIETSVETILGKIDKLKYELKTNTTTNQNYFVEFLNKLSLPGDLGKEIIVLRQLAEKIQKEQEYLDLIEKTIKVICSAQDTEQENKYRLIHLLEQLTLPADATHKIVKIRDQISTNQYTSLKDINNKISRVINEVNVELQRELDDIRHYLNRLIGQLSVLYGHLQFTQREQSLSCAEAENLNKDIKQHAEEMHSEIESINDLDQLKSSIDAHMVKIQTSLKEHMVSELQRKEATEERVKELKDRLQNMENETLNLKEKLNQEHNNAHRDILTGIANRLSYEEQIKKEFARSKRYQQPLTMAVIDIDNFKKINDRFGHKAGDKVLKAVATVCKENIRDSDFLARYGGEEFILLLPETDLEETGIAVENLRRVVENCNFYHQSQTVLVTISVGFAEFRPDDDVDSVFHRADMALYTAKSAGRNRCVSDMQIENAA